MMGSMLSESRDGSQSFKNYKTNQQNSNFSGSKMENVPDNSCHSPGNKKIELKRSITFFGVVAILIANIGGTGVFIAPTTILKLSGSPGLAVITWTVGGLIQVSLAFCVVQLAQLFNKAGGPYYFINRVFGDLASFVFMWGYLIFIAAPSWALGAYTASLYLLSLIFGDCLPSDGLIKLVAAWIMSKYTRGVFCIM